MAISKKQLAGAATLAIKKGDLHCLQAAFDHGLELEDVIDAGERALHLAAALNQLEVMDWLLARGANPNARGERAVTPLLRAMESSKEAAQRLLAAGADPKLTDEDHRTPLHKASLLRKPDLVQLLLDYPEPINQGDWHDSTPLILAFALAYSPRDKDQGLETARLLLAAGADPHHFNYTGLNPLIVASQCDMVEGIELLLSYGAAIEAVNLSSETALHHAAAHNSIRSLIKLIELGGPLDVVDMQGRTFQERVNVRYADEVQRAVERQRLTVLSGLADRVEDLPSTGLSL